MKNIIICKTIDLLMTLIVYKIYMEKVKCDKHFPLTNIH